MLHLQRTANQLIIPVYLYISSPSPIKVHLFLWHWRGLGV